MIAAVNKPISALKALAVGAGFLGLFVIPLPARAALQLVTNGAAMAHKKPDENSAGLFNLKADQAVVVVGKTKNKWVRVKNPKRPAQEGYLPFSAVRIPGRKPPALHAGAVENSRHPYTAGLTLVYSSLSQQGRTFKDGNPPVDISTLNGSTFYFGGFFMLPVAPGWKLQFGAELRSLNLSGETKVISTVPTNPSALSVKQDFFGVRGAALHSLTPAWAVGAGAEIAQALTSTVTTTTSADQPEKPLYAIIQLSTNYDFKFSEWLVSPELRVGAVVNSNPMMINIEFATNIGYRF